MNSQLVERIRAGSAQVGVIGLGYVGLSVACMLARSGFQVAGVDINAERVETINTGNSPIGGEEPGLAELLAEVRATGRLRAATDYSPLRDVQIVLICVDTPIEPETHYPAYRGLRTALALLGPVLAEGALVIVESTIAPGTMTGVVIPELEKASDKCAGVDFYVGHCPERVTPGLLLHNLVNVSRTVGGQTPDVAETMLELYRHFVRAELDPSDLLTAEIVKTAENAYRDVQIAFANELALICDALGANVYTVRKLLNKSPGRNMLLPGAGVGGHCIPKDPWLLIANLNGSYQAQLIPAARAVNNLMPSHVIELLREALEANGLPLKGARIAVLGYAFREDTDDDRDSPSMYVVEQLKRAGAEPVIHDPHIRAYNGPLENALQGAQAVVLMVAHKQYRQLDLNLLRQHMACPVLVDGRNIIDAARANQLGFTYRGVGNGLR